MATTLLLRLLITLALLAVPQQLASAAECTTAQLAALRAFDANATEVCGTSLLSPSASSVICTKPACLSYVVSLEDQVPFCDIQGINLRAFFSFARSFCVLQSNETDAVSFTRTPSSAAASTSYGSSGGAILLTALTTLLLAILSAAL